MPGIVKVALGLVLGGGAGLAWGYMTRCLGSS
jgi:hypothetical protein